VGPPGDRGRPGPEAPASELFLGLQKLLPALSVSVRPGSSLQASRPPAVRSVLAPPSRPPPRQEGQPAPTASQPPLPARRLGLWFAVLGLSTTPGSAILTFLGLLALGSAIAAWWLLLG
jgi:hypothetical protein